MIIFYKIISLEQSKAFNKITKLKKQLKILYDEIELIELVIEQGSGSRIVNYGSDEQSSGSGEQSSGNKIKSKDYQNSCEENKYLFNQRLILIKESIDLKNQANHIKKKLEKTQLKQVSEETLKQYPGLKWSLLLHTLTKNKSDSESDSNSDSDYYTADEQFD